jgi:hypothetical protein
MRTTRLIIFFFFAFSQLYGQSESRKYTFLLHAATPNSHPLSIQQVDDLYVVTFKDQVLTDIFSRYNIHFYSRLSQQSSSSLLRDVYELVCNDTAISSELTNYNPSLFPIIEFAGEMELLAYFPNDWTLAGFNDAQDHIRLPEA